MKQPYAYIVVLFSYRGDASIVGSGRTLTEAMEGVDLNATGDISVTALIDGGRVLVPLEAYTVPDPPSEDEALQFIRQRDQRIKESQGAAASIWRIMGIGRCNADDPEDKQVRDYIATAPRKKATIMEEDWWR